MEYSKAEKYILEEEEVVLLRSTKCSGQDVCSGFSFVVLSAASSRTEKAALIIVEF
jgi:hypothetical protein